MAHEDSLKACLQWLTHQSGGSGADLTREIKDALVWMDLEWHDRYPDFKLEKYLRKHQGSTN